jgi:hypothetical protein
LTINSFIRRLPVSIKTGKQLERALWDSAVSFR